LRQEPTANESAGNPDKEMADQPEVGASYDLTYPATRLTMSMINKLSLDM
jgi:hypothetical protein